MRKSGRLLLTLAGLGLAASLAALGYVGWVVVPSTRQDARQMASDLRRYCEGVRVVKDSARLAQDLCQVDSDARQARIEALREHVKYQRRNSVDLRDSLVASPATLDALAYLPNLLVQADDLLETALTASPSQTVSATRAATAPVLSIDANVTGVLPGTANLVNARANQVVQEATAHFQKAEVQLFGAGMLGEGLSPRQWIALVAAMGLLSVLLGLMGLRCMQGQPGQLLEEQITFLSQRDLHKAVELCHGQAKNMMDLAERLMKEAS